MAKPKKASIDSLRRELDETEAKVDAINFGSDPGLIKTGLELTGLTAKMHMLRYRLCTEKAREADDDKDRRSWENTAENEDKRHHEWRTQFARLANQLKTDLLPEIIRKLEERDRQADRLLGIPQLGA